MWRIKEDVDFRSQIRKTLGILRIVNSNMNHLSDAVSWQQYESIRFHLFTFLIKPWWSLVEDRMYSLKDTKRYTKDPG